MMSTGITNLFSRTREKLTPGGSAIWPIIEHFFNDEYIRLDTTHITPWAFSSTRVKRKSPTSTANPLPITASHSKVLHRSYFGMVTSSDFCKHIASRAIDLALRAVRERNIKTREPLLDAQGQLYSLIRRAFDRMATIDHNLRFADAHTDVPMKNTDSKQEQVRHFVDRRIEAEFKALPPTSKRWTKLNQWHKDNPIISWAIGLSIAIAGLVGKLKGLFNSVNSLGIPNAFHACMHWFSSSSS